MSVLHPTGCPSTISGAANSRFDGGRTSRFLVTLTASPMSTNFSKGLLPDKSTITFSGCKRGKTGLLILALGSQISQRHMNFHKQHNSTLLKDSVSADMPSLVRREVFLSVTTFNQKFKIYTPCRDVVVVIIVFCEDAQCKTLETFL
jgi:hypothetical protein